MAKRRPLYEALGADDKDDVETITRKYRRKAKELHPDKRPGDAAAAEEFKRVAEAFEVLSDPVKRLTYDQTGEVPDDRNDPRRRALLLLARTVHKIIADDIAGDRKTTTRALIKDLKATLDSRVEEIETAIAAMEKEAATIEEIASRFEAPDGEENVLASIVRGPLTDLRARIAMAADVKQVTKLAYDLAKGYKFRSDKAGGSTTEAVTIGGVRFVIQRGR